MTHNILVRSLQVRDKSDFEPVLELTGAEEHIISKHIQLSFEEIIT